jgi:cell division protein FtsZ
MVHPLQVPVGAATPAGLAPSNGGQHAAPSQQTQEPAAAMGRPPRKVTFEDSDDLDVPDFLK